MQETLFTNSLHSTSCSKFKKEINKTESDEELFIELTAMGHHQLKGHRPLHRQIQAASLISKGLPTGPQGQIDAPPRYEVHHSC